MPVTRSPRVFVSYAGDSGAHTDTVHEFARELRGQLGIDVRLDLWERDRRRDWLEWVVDQIEQGDFVLAIGSPEYKRLAASDGESQNHARFQLAMLREHLAADRARWLPKILPVVLPGCSADDLPAFLQPYSATRYVVPAQLDELLRVLTGRPPLRPAPAGTARRPRGRRTRRVVPRPRAERGPEPGTARGRGGSGGRRRRLLAG
ncbi:SEFIR domain-containing protein [Amycolatopsis sp. cmx-4-61]|uniref:SEFIR domain-containing protein n=1 Tax=Amycolatopsis sp. cmx-4-61 TaxID=2790937 RepID=UPI00397E704C